ncbi:VanW family protein [Limnochorda pilosa]|uniref:VanW family protein n=1 Tax=Limnochorda pilosa TaxID=1555112 RepID=A0A0K2SFL9_LIMPI|nr:VanW family protein [Limnochorda pilosa]BAS25903.1 VanW family protein [Limnochorda pilosa]
MQRHGARWAALLGTLGAALILVGSLSFRSWGPRLGLILPGHRAPGHDGPPLAGLPPSTAPEGDGDSDPTDPFCGIPGTPEPDLSGPVSAGGLPWAGNEPPALSRLRQELGADRLVAAYRTVLPHPLPGEEANVRHAANLLAGAVVGPGEAFSQNHRLGPYSRDRGYREGPAYAGGRVLVTVGGGVCKIASTLYNVVVLAQLRVLERHAHSMLVPYVPPGQDATVSYGSKDFRFQNSSPGPVVIWAESVDHTLTIALYGSYTPPAIRWHHEIAGRTEPPVIRQFNAQLPPGQERVAFEGAPGLVVHSWITVGTGTSARTGDLGWSTYRPMPKVIEFGPDR